MSFALFLYMCCELWPQLLWLFALLKAFRDPFNSNACSLVFFEYFTYIRELRPRAYELHYRDRLVFIFYKSFRLWASASNSIFAVPHLGGALLFYVPQSRTSPCRPYPWSGHFVEDFWFHYARTYGCSFSSGPSPAWLTTFIPMLWAPASAVIK